MRNSWIPEPGDEPICDECGSSRIADGTCQRCGNVVDDDGSGGRCGSWPNCPECGSVNV